MEAIKLFEKKNVPLEWKYDEEAVTLYFSFGDPRQATGIDVGQGVILRYDEQAREREVVGLTIVGVGRRLEGYVKRKA